MTKFILSASLLLCINSMAYEQTETSAKQEGTKSFEIIEREGSFVQKEFGIVFVAKDGEDFMIFKNSAEKVKHHMNTMVKIKAQAQAGEHRKQLVYIDSIKAI